jgi:hypothetical protein
MLPEPVGQTIAGALLDSDDEDRTVVSERVHELRIGLQAERMPGRFCGAAEDRIRGSHGAFRGLS